MFTYTREDILQALNETDKSVLKITDDRIEKIKKNTALEKAFKTLENCREYYKDRAIMSIPFSLYMRYSIDGDRKEYEYGENGYFVRRGHLKTWALSLLFDKENAEYKQRLEDIIWAICDEHAWILPAHDMLRCHGMDIFGAETVQALAEIIYLLGDKLHPLVVERAKKKLMSRGVNNFFEHKNEDFFWADSARVQGNWTTVCAGSLGIAAMYMLDDNEKLSEFLYRANKAVELYFDAYPKDGACPEGILYWGYGFGYFCYYAETLYIRTGGKINLFDNELVKKLAAFPSKMLFYGGRSVAFSDGSSRASIQLGLTSMLKHHYPDIKIPENVSQGAGVEVVGCHRFADNLRSFIWSDGFLEAENCAETYIFDEVQWYVATGADNVSFCCKGGHNDEHHNHNDVGHFQVFKDGEEFFADFGQGVYSRQYFTEPRYTFIQAGSQGHSVPIINGNYQKAGKEYCAKDVIIQDDGMSLDISGAYGIPELKKLHRTFRFEKESATVRINDEFALAGATNEVIERFVSRIKPQLLQGEIRLSADGKSVSLYYDKSAFTPSFEEIDSGRGIVYTIDLKVNKPKENMVFEFIIK